MVESLKNKREGIFTLLLCKWQEREKSGDDIFMMSGRDCNGEGERLQGKRDYRGRGGEIEGERDFKGK